MNQVFYYIGLGGLKDRYSGLNVRIQLVGDYFTYSFSSQDKMEVLKDANLCLNDLLDDFNSDYLIDDKESFRTEQDAKNVISIINNIRDNEKDAFFISGKIINNEHRPLLCYQDIKAYRGKVGGPVLHIHRSELGKYISMEFYRSLYDEWKTDANRNRFLSFWEDIDNELIFNYDITFDENLNSVNFFI